MKPPPMDFARQAAVMACTAKTLELLAPLDHDMRIKVVVGVVIAVCTEDGPRGKALVDDLMRKMVGEAGR